MDALRAVVEESLEQAERFRQAAERFLQAQAGADEEAQAEAEADLSVEADWLRWKLEALKELGD